MCISVSLHIVRNAYPRAREGWDGTMINSLTLKVVSSDSRPGEQNIKSFVQLELFGDSIKVFPLHY